MADKRISELTALTGANVADTDLLPIVDTSATETKKITFGEFKTALDTATGFVRITGDTMTGDLIVNANVGIGTSSPDRVLHLNNSGTEQNVRAKFTNGTTGEGASDGFEIGINASNPAEVVLVNYEASPMAFFTSGSERMRVTSGGTLQIAGGGNDNVGEINMGNTAQNASRFQVRHQSSAWYLKTVDSEPLILGTANTERMRIDTSGNVGIGTTSPILGKLHVLASGTSDASMENVAHFGKNSTSRAGLQIYANATRVDLGIQAQAGAGNIDLTLSSLANGNNLERIRIDSSGNVGIGTALPNGKLDITGSGNTDIYLNTGNNSGDNNRIFFGDTADIDTGYLSYDHGTNSMTFGVNGTVERMRIDASGRVAIGDTPIASFTGHSILQVGGQAILGANDALSTTGQTYLTHNIYYDISGTPQVFNTSTSNEGTVYAQVDGTHRWSNSAQTTGTPSVQERVRIDSSGNLLVGATTFANAANVVNIGSDGVISIGCSTTAQTVRISLGNANGQVGRIMTSGSSAIYATTSDYRLKEDLQPMTGASERVQALKPVNFAWVVDGTRVDGFLAHEAQAVVPEAVTGTKDAMRDEEYEVTAAVYEDIIIAAVLDEDGNELEAERTEQRLVTEAVMGTRSVPDYQGIDQSKLVPLLTAALQEALTEISALKARVTALEG
jgi:hypothetical protein